MKFKQSDMRYPKSKTELTFVFFVLEWSRNCCTINASLATELVKSIRY